MPPHIVFVNFVRQLHPDPYFTISNVTAHAPNVLRLEVVKLDATTVEVRRFKGAATTPGVIHRFETTTVEGLPAVRHTEIVGTTTTVDVNAGLMANGGRAWRMEAADGTVGKRGQAATP